MRKKQLSDTALERLLAEYRVTVDTGETAIEALVGVARRRAAEIHDAMESNGFFATVASSLGFHRLRAAAWSGASFAALVLAVGLSLGVTNTIPRFDSHAVALDLDAAMGSNTLATGSVLAGEDDEAL